MSNPSKKSWEGLKVCPITTIDAELRRFTNPNWKPPLTKPQKKKILEETTIIPLHSDTFRSLKPFLRYYQVLGLLPISLTSGPGARWYTRRTPLLWTCTAFSLIVQSTMVIRSFKQLITIAIFPFGPVTTEDQVGAVNDAIYYFHALAMTLIMLWRYTLIPDFFIACKKMETALARLLPDNDKMIRPHYCWIVFGVFLLSQVGGNGLYYYSTAAKFNVTSLSEFSEAFESVDEHELKGDFDQIMGILFGIFELFCDCVWTFGDCLTALSAVVLTQFFTLFNKALMNRDRKHSAEDIEELRQHHNAIRRIVDKFNTVFSPIILVNFVGNITYLLTRLYVGLSVDLQNSYTIVRVESIYAFFYQIGKIAIPTWLAAQVNDKASQTGGQFLLDLPSYPSDSSNGSIMRIQVINRFALQLKDSSSIGISGFGYFIITKNFLVTLISGILTYEVVILQFQQSSQGK